MSDYIKIVEVNKNVSFSFSKTRKSSTMQKWSIIRVSYLKHVIRYLYLLIFYKIFWSEISVLSNFAVSFKILVCRVSLVIYYQW